MRRWPPLRPCPPFPAAWAGCSSGSGGGGALALASPNLAEAFGVIATAGQAGRTSSAGVIISIKAEDGVPDRARREDVNRVPGVDVGEPGVVASKSARASPSAWAGRPLQSRPEGPWAWGPEPPRNVKA